MKVRRAARRLALDVLYEAEIRHVQPVEAWELAADSGWSMSSSEGDDIKQSIAYAQTLVQGVQEHMLEIDALIASLAEGWTMDRMPLIDKALLRIATLELLWESDVPVAVAINEAVELAKEYSTNDSGRFLNGVLGRIAEGAR